MAGSGASLGGERKGPVDEKKPADPVLPTMVAVSTPSDEIEKIALPIVDADLEAYAQLARHYTHWYWLAKGSWGELEKVAEITLNCRALLSQLSAFDGVEGQKELVDTFTKLQTVFSALSATGPRQTHVFCTSLRTDPESKESIDKLKALSPIVIPDHPAPLSIKDAVIGFVGSGKEASAFVQGMKDNAFVSEAHLSPAIKSNKDKLREFVFDQIESFHADPRNVGKTIVFEGNYSKEFLALALDYCHYREINCRVADELRDRLIEKSYLEQKLAVSQLLAPRVESNSAAEAEWKTWLTQNNKYPFNKMLTEEKKSQYETTLGLQPLGETENDQVKKKCSELAQNHTVTSATWALATPSPSDLSRFNATPAIAKRPVTAAISIRGDEDKTSVAEAESQAANAGDAESFASFRGGPRRGSGSSGV